VAEISISADGLEWSADDVVRVGTALIERAR
jgi:hypothetical protein